MDRFEAPSEALEESWGLQLSRTQPDRVPGRCPVLFEVRESNENNRALFDSMREQTYRAFRSNPWVEAVYRAGMAPMDARGSHVFRVDLPSGEFVVEVLVERITRGRTVVVRFQVGPFLHLWSMASAATANEQGDNDFTQILVDQVRDVRPQVMIAANIGRLVRSSQENGLLMKVLPDHVDQVWAGPAQMVLRGEGSAYGRMQFSTLGMMAAMERDWIVLRLMTGRIAAWHRGDWPLGSHSVPFGYRLERRRLVPVPELADRVQQMLLILGDDEAPSLTMRRLVAEQLPMRRVGDERTLGESVTPWVNPSAVVDNFLSWVPLWVAGEYLWRFGCPLKDTDQIAGVPVVRASGQSEGPGELQLLLTPGVPEGGWAPQEVLDRVALVAAERFAAKTAAGRAVKEFALAPATAAASAIPELHARVVGPSNTARRVQERPRPRGTATVSAFSGYHWIDGQDSFELRKTNSHSYEVLRRRLPGELEIVGGGER